MPELSLNHVSVKYGNKVAVNHVTYKFHHGVYGLLGANGAGKTTLMRMLCNLLQPGEGEILYIGKELGSLGGEYRRVLGYLPQEFGYYPEFTGERFLRYLGQLKAIPRGILETKIDEMLQITGLEQERKRKIKTYSGGMKRRLGIAQALLNDPEVLILDEPTAGLDPKERIRFRNLIGTLGKSRIVILSTHIVSDIEYAADQIILMKNGSFILQGKAEEVEAALEGKVWEMVIREEKEAEYEGKYAVSQLKAERREHGYSGESGVRVRIVSEEKPEREAKAVTPTLEDVYLYYFQDEKGGK